VEGSRRGDRPGDRASRQSVWVRLFRTLRLWIPRKNGKSEFLAALALLFWALEGVVGGQGYIFARDEVQAELPFKRMKAMVALNAELARDVQPHKRRCTSSRAPPRSSC
jgi:phage terminase large subunit-like protein